MFLIALVTGQWNLNISDFIELSGTKNEWQGLNINTSDVSK